jgi:hypothetical protein
LIARNGDRVRQGDYIAKIGRTGNARGVHLHFELRNSENKPIDPLPYLKHRSIAKAPERDLPRLVKSSSRAKQPKVARSGKGRSAKKGLLYARD